METKKFKRLYDAVDFVLENYPETRNSDIELTITIWREYYPELLFNGGKCIYLRDLYDLPREDNVKRIRAKIQNDEWRLLPTDLNVAKARNMNIDRWREALGYPPEGFKEAMHQAHVDNAELDKKFRQEILI